MIETLLVDVEQAAASGGARRREVLLRRVTELFTAQADLLGQPQLNAFDEVILVLARPAESTSRAALSNVLAGIPNAPARVVRDLAYDTAASVACPVLAQSPRIAEDDLVAIAGLRGQDHLGALARRPVLNERVTDVLVQRGGPVVHRTLIANDRARFSETALDTLAELALADADFLQALEGRADKPGRSGNRRPATGRTGESRSPPRDAAMARNFTAEAIGQQEKVILALLERGNLQQAGLITARIADIPVQMALSAFRAPDHAPLLLLFRTIGFGWTTLRLFIEAKPAMDLSPEEWRAIFDTYHALSEREARRTVRQVAQRFRAA